MRKHLAFTLSSLALFLILTLTEVGHAGQLPSAIPQLPPEMLAEFAKEPALTQADLDEYIRLMPQLAKVGGDPEAALEILSQSDLSPNRVGLVGYKIAVSMPAILLGGQIDPKLPKELRPSGAELKLIENNIPNLMKSTMGMLQGAGAN